MSKQKKKEFYAFPVEVLNRIGVFNAKLFGFDAMLNDALLYSFYKTYLSRNNFAEDELNEYAAQDALQVLGLDSIDFGQAREVYKHYSNANVITSISRALYWDLRENAESRGEFFMLQAVTALALKSILGAFAPIAAKRIGWEFVLSRMAGNPKTTKRHPAHVKKYATRKMRDKMIKALCRYWGFSYYSPRGTRGGWFAFGMKPRELAEYVEKKAKKKPQNKVHL